MCTLCNFYFYTNFGKCELTETTENAGQGKCRTCKMTEQISALENTSPNHFARSYVSIISSNNKVIPNKCVITEK